ncbi:Microtubule-associated tumor suppressor 1 A [Orchesella cincta]|uniref:Microtubule-associated tumor suppressor 1 A n=1 Tax=Orchesella cincta TaxID=48709 RepID=A0A1D2N107_ORCCI|nr:Microtubule-associated tumor suppressor 1 A [Orchesella cincta]
MLQKRHDETLAELKRSHTDELERLHESHRQELDQTIQKHKELLDEHRKQSPHDILHKEVESLQIVVEMRNEEIRVLRKDLMDYKNTLNDLQMAREYGKTLQAKIEDLEAQLEKARADKRSLQEGYQMLESNLQQTESENNRLSRCNEELHWKIKSHNLEEN